MQWCHQANLDYANTHLMPPVRWQVKVVCRSQGRQIPICSQSVLAGIHIVSLVHMGVSVDTTVTECQSSWRSTTELLGSGQNLAPQSGIVKVTQDEVTVNVQPSLLVLLLELGAISSDENVGRS